MLNDFQCIVVKLSCREAHALAALTQWAADGSDCTQAFPTALLIAAAAVLQTSALSHQTC